MSGHDYITDRLRAKCTPDTSPEIRALLNEAATVIEGRDRTLRGNTLHAALSGIVDHWWEFGEMMVNNHDDYGFDERIDAAAKLVVK